MTKSSWLLGHRGEVGRVGGRGLQEGMKKLLQEMDMFIYLDFGDGSLVWIYIYTYLFIYFKYVYFIIFQSYFNKTILQINNNHKVQFFNLMCMLESPGKF